MDNSHTGLPVFMLVRSVGFACLVYILGNLREYLRASKNRNLPAINFSPASNFSAVIFRETDENNKVQLYGWGLGIVSSSAGEKERRFTPITLRKWFTVSAIYARPGVRASS